VEKPHA